MLEDEVDRLRRLVPQAVDDEMANWSLWSRAYRGGARGYQAGSSGFAHSGLSSLEDFEHELTIGAAKTLSSINSEMDQVRRDRTLTPAEKRTRIDELTVQRNALLRLAVTESKPAQKEAQP